MKVESMFLDGEILGSYLATLFGLNRHYFSRAYKENINVNVQMRDINGFVFVKVPHDVRALIDQGFISCKIEKEDTAIYVHRYELSKNCTIGFWK